jgi:S-formylglutathione hydrolase FrmB
MTLRALALVLLALVLAVAPAADAEVRSATFRSDALGREVAYVVDLPPSYGSAPARRYPVVYAFHGLFEGPGFWERRSLAPILASLRETGAVPEFLLVAVDGGNSFFVNGKAGRFEDMATRDLVAHVEGTYRVVPGRAGRAALGVSMGGYAALRLALTQPSLYRAVATHSAMLLERVPSTEQGAGRWHMAAFNGVFGNPIDLALWAANDPIALAAKADPQAVPALYLDCGSEDRYGLATGHRDLDAALNARGIAHRLEVAPGDHGYDFVRARLEKSLRFLGEALK